MANFVSRFGKNDSGVTALEYGILAGLIAAVIITAVTTLGVDIAALFTGIAAAIGAIPVPA